MLLKPSFYTIKLKKNFFTIVFLFFLLSLIIFSTSNLTAVKSALILWATAVVPALFPFFVATELLMHTNIVTILGNKLNKFTQLLFNVSGKGAFAFIMGIISGYPTGAKIASNFRENKICSKEECERLLSFTNNSGPLFIVGTVGIFMFKSSTIGFLLLITHILASITVGIIFRYWKYGTSSSSSTPTINTNFNHQYSINFSNLGEVLTQSITNSISTIFLIGGFIVIFSSIICILKACGIFHIISFMLSPIFNYFNINLNFIEPTLIGFLEISNGISTISNIMCKKISINLILTAFLLGFGGFSVLFQVLSITSKTDLSIKPYIYGKLLQGFLAALYTYLLIQIIPFFNFNL